MMGIQKTLKYLMPAILLMLVGGTAVAETPTVERHIDFDKETPSATLELESKAISLLIGGAWGSGTLHYQGKDYPFKVKGLRAGGVGYQAVDAVGKVYFLNKLEDFAGTYGAVTAGATAYKGAAAATFENDKGVVLGLEAKTEGLSLMLGAGGVSIELEE